MKCSHEMSCSWLLRHGDVTWVVSGSGWGRQTRWLGTDMRAANRSQSRRKSTGPSNASLIQHPLVQVSKCVLSLAPCSSIGLAPQLRLPKLPGSPGNKILVSRQPAYTTAEKSLPHIPSKPEKATKRRERPVRLPSTPTPPERPKARPRKGGVQIIATLYTAAARKPATAAFAGRSRVKWTSL